MSRFSSSGWFAVVALVVATPSAIAQDQPRSGIPWLQEARESVDEDRMYLPLPGPEEVRGDSPAPETEDPESTELIDQLGDAVVAVSELPEPTGREFGSEIWPELPSDSLVERIEQIRPTGLHAANRLLRGILLTPHSGEERVLAEPRARALLALGALPDALRVASEAGEVRSALLPARLTVELLLDPGESSCETARTRGYRPRGTAGVFCAAVLGETIRAESLLTLAIDDRLVDEFEIALLDAIISPSLLKYVSPPEDPSAFTPSHLGLMEHLEIPLPETLAETPPVALLWRDTEAGIDPRQRIAALERLESEGLVVRESLTDAYEEIADDAIGTEESFLWARLYRTALQSREDAQLPELLVAGLRLGRDHGREDAVARILSVTARYLLPSPGNSRHARALQRMFLLAGDTDSAAFWVPVPAGPREATLLAVASIGEAAPILPVAIEDLAARYEIDDDSRDGRLLAALAAFDHWEPAEEFATDGELEAALLDAEGIEAALVALAAIRGPDTPPGDLHAIIRGLRRAGFDSWARQIAIETVLLGN